MGTLPPFRRRAPTGARRTARYCVPLGRLALVALVLVACSDGPPPAKTQIQASRPANITVRNPSRDFASVTGMSCSGLESEAMLNARRIAAYNLRSVTGPNTNEMVFKVLEKKEQGRKICVTVEATAQRKSRR